MRSHPSKYLKAGIWSMVVLLLLMAFAPTYNGLRQRSHRTARHLALRRGKLDLPTVQLVLSKTEALNSYLPLESELILHGLHYDVLSVNPRGNVLVFNAVPDLKENRLCALSSASGPFSHAMIGQCPRMVQPDFLPDLQDWSDGCLGWFSPKTDFGPQNNRLLEGFEWLFSPPPDAMGFNRA